MTMTKLKQALYALAFASLALLSSFIIQDPLGVGVTSSPLRKILHAVVVFFIMYYVLGAFFGRKEDQQGVKYSYWSLEMIRIISLLLVITAIIGVVLVFSYQNPIVIGIALGAWYLFTFMITMIHLYYGKRIPGVSILLFVIAYITCGALIFLTPKGYFLKILMFLLFALVSMISLFYGVYVLLKYILPQMIEHNFERQMRRYQKKRSADKDVIK